MTELEKLEAGLEYCYDDPEVDGRKEQAIIMCKKMGTKSGWKIDKARESGLTLEPSEVNGVSGIKEFPLTIECKVVYQSLQALADIRTDNVAQLYPSDVEDDLKSRNSRPHDVYYGEILSAYIIED